MIVIECNNENEVKQILDAFNNQKKCFEYQNNLFNEIVNAAKEIGYPVVICNEDRTSYYFGSTPEDVTKEISFSDYMKNKDNVHLLMKDVEKTFVHYNHFFNSDCSLSIKDKITEIMISKMEKVINEYKKNI